MGSDTRDVITGTDSKSAAAWVTRVKLNKLAPTRLSCLSKVIFEKSDLVLSATFLLLPIFLSAVFPASARPSWSGIGPSQPPPRSPHLSAAPQNHPAFLSLPSQTLNGLTPSSLCLALCLLNLAPIPRHDHTLPTQTAPRPGCGADNDPESSHSHPDAPLPLLAVSGPVTRLG